MGTKLSLWLRFKIKLKNFFKKLIESEASKQIFIHLINGIIFCVAFSLFGLSFSLRNILACAALYFVCELFVDWLIAIRNGMKIE